MSPLHYTPSLFLSPGTVRIKCSVLSAGAPKARTRACRAPQRAKSAAGRARDDPLLARLPQRPRALGAKARGVRANTGAKP